MHRKQSPSSSPRESHPDHWPELTTSNDEFSSWSDEPCSVSSDDPFHLDMSMFDLDMSMFDERALAPTSTSAPPSTANSLRELKLDVGLDISVFASLAGPLNFPIPATSTQYLSLNTDLPPRINSYSAAYKSKCKVKHKAKSKPASLNHEQLLLCDEIKQYVQKCQASNESVTHRDRVTQKDICTWLGSLAKCQRVALKGLYPPTLSKMMTDKTKCVKDVPTIQWLRAFLCQPNPPLATKIASSTVKKPRKRKASSLTSKSVRVNEHHKRERIPVNNMVSPTCDDRTHKAFQRLLALGWSEAQAQDILAGPNVTY